LGWARGRPWRIRLTGGVLCGNADPSKCRLYLLPLGLTFLLNGLLVARDVLLPIELAGYVAEAMGDVDPGF
jgi:hypothetical protein